MLTSAQEIEPPAHPTDHNSNRMGDVLVGVPATTTRAWGWTVVIFISCPAWDKVLFLGYVDIDCDWVLGIRHSVFGFMVFLSCPLSLGVRELACRQGTCFRDHGGSWGARVVLDWLWPLRVRLCQLDVLL